jgi:quercetin dioxygenase-like cupin family protein
VVVTQLREISTQEIVPGFFAKIIHSQHMTFVYWDALPQAILPEHSHPHEQVAHIQEGEFELVLEGRPYVLKAGDVMVIPPYAVHSGQARTACKILDVFSPLREDYL